MEHINEIEMLSVIGGYASPDTQDRCNLHIKECDECHCRWNELRQTWDDLDVFDEDLDDINLLPGILARIELHDQNTHFFTSRNISRIAATLIFAAGIGFTAGKITNAKTSEQWFWDTAEASYLQFLAPDSYTGLAESGLSVESPERNGSL